MIPVLILLLAIAFVSLFFFIPLPDLFGGRGGLSRAGRRPAVRERRSSRSSDRAAGEPDAGGREARASAAASSIAENVDSDLDPDLPPLHVVQLRYDGGDWSAVPDALRRLCEFYRGECEPRDFQVGFGLRGRLLEQARPDFVFATGHHGFSLAGVDRQGLLAYLGAGGVVLIEDNNGMDYAFRRFLDETWPHHKLEAVSGGPLFESHFALSFYPKIRQHQGKPARLFRIRLDERELDFYYSFSSDLGDGWQNHPYLNVAPDKRRLALEMGSNFLAHALARNGAPGS